MIVDTQILFYECQMGCWTKQVLGNFLLLISEVISWTLMDNHIIEQVLENKPFPFVAVFLDQSLSVVVP